MKLDEIKTNLSAKYFVQKAFEVRDQIHYWHLQTKGLAEHKALNEFYNEWLDLCDDLIETYQGKYGRIEGNINISINTYDDNVVKFFVKLTEDLSVGGSFRKLLNSVDTDMNNILDEMLGLVNKTKYLLTLK